jgi:tetratricopeptide (TPR) repeat protein
VPRAEKAWHEVWTAPKPTLVSFDLELSESLIHEPEPWLDVLRRHPQALDSLDVLDSLVLMAGAAAEEVDAEWDGPLLAPLLDRAAAIVRASVGATEGLVRLPWSFLENRPALRVLSRLAYRLDGLGRTDEAAAVYEEVLGLNPNDNHGHRAWLMNHALRRGDDARALALADQFPDDALADTLFGRGLALWRLGRRGEGEEALRAAASDRPLVVEALVAFDPPEPALIPGRVTLGGEAEAWLYGEDTRDLWEETPDALDFLRGLPKAAAARGRRRRRPSR